MDVFEALGRKQLQLDNLNAEYDRLLGLLAQVTAGEVAYELVRVDVGNRGWKVLSVEEHVEAVALQAMLNARGETEVANGEPS